MDNTFLLSRIFCGLSFVFYNYIGFQYVEVVLSSVRLSKSKKILISILNTILYLALSTLGLIISVVYLCGFLTLVLEFKFIYKLKFRRIIYVSSTFMFNIAAVRSFVLSGFALVTFQAINQISGNSSLYNFAMAVSFLILDVIMLLFVKEKFVTFEDLTIFSKAKVQETYAAILASLIFAYIMLFSSTHAYTISYIDLTILNFITPITLATLYYVSFSYGIRMSKMVAVERRSRALESELKETLESKLKLEHIAYVDPLTSAYSRRYCIDKIVLFLDEGIQFSLCFIDVDKLKMVNDEFGHTEGDIYLQMIAEVLRTVLRRDDIISRMGGDEFVILLPHCKKDIAKKRMKLAHQKIFELPLEHNLKHETSISYGIIGVDENNNLGVDELLSKADKLMYQFKLEQKNKKTTSL